MTDTRNSVGKKRAERGRKQDRYWLVWVAAGCGVGSVLPHVMV